MSFAETAIQIAPCYYVSGNHEATVRNAFSQLEAGLSELGVSVLRNEKLTLNKIILLLGLVLSGHSHGGQIRLPFIGAVVAPDQVFFPEYDAGLFVENETNMLVSSGLGGSVIPVRFLNPPEIVLIELCAVQQKKIP